MNSLKIFNLSHETMGNLYNITKGQPKLDKIVIGVATSVVLYCLEGRERVGIRIVEDQSFSYLNVTIDENIKLRSVLNIFLKQAKAMEKEEEIGEVVSVFSRKLYNQKIIKDDFLTIGVDKSDLICFFSEAFSVEQIGIYVKYIYKVIAQIAKDANVFIKDISLLSESEEKCYFHKWQGMEKNIPPGHMAVFFEKSFVKYVNKTAVYSSQCSLTYKQLDKYSQNLAVYLKNIGVKENRRVAVLCSHRVETIVAVVAIARVGAIYVPLDVRSPSERNDIILKDSGVICIVNTLSSPINRFTNLGLPVVDVGDCKYDNGHGVDFELEGKLDSYIVYTSGTTGIPKGVVISEEFLKNLCYWYIDAFNIDENSRIIHLNSFGFDASIKNIYAPLIVGGAIVMGPEDLYDTFDIARLVDRFEVSHINCVPVLFHALIETVRYNNYRELDQVRYVILGGDVFEREKLLDWARLNRCQASFGNVYGPTESTSVSVWHSFSKEELISMDKVPLGRPIYNKRAYVQNRFKKICPPGIKGKLWLGGEGTIESYINPERNENKFLKDPFVDIGVIYDTGDVVWFDENGILWFVGRKDNQIKVNGQRVELEEIEAIMKLYPSVKEAVVIKKGAGLVGFYTMDSGQKTLDSSRLIAFMESRLNRSLVPSRFVLMPSINLNSNGKPDRKSLEKIDLGNNSDDELKEKTYIGEERELIEKITRAWKNTLGTENIVIEHSFFEQGGTSIMLFKLKQEIQKVVGISVEMVDILNYPSIHKLGDWLLQKENNKYNNVHSFEVIASKRRKVKMIMRRKRNVGDIGG